MNTPGVEANGVTCDLRYTPPQQPQRCIPGKTSNAAGNANMAPW
jgi:hypothetical protein